MMEEELIVYQDVLASFVTLNTEQRYLKLLASNHPILRRIQQHQLATYLGVTAETISSIRKRIVAKVATWTKGVVPPGLDSANYKFIVSDSYAIETQGDIAVIAVFRQWCDITLI
jgi:hypothetical protein